ncbi:hypothetical protein GUITHDRAFT_114444 [Guillardia theta CCMP2712]|uniref:TLDc domain-containing protein n=1 Tax=Guillardia theta (strain CCMP2712) TaxID=905079 RepID=L1IT88_GUITC|nr:hypothetical protein GUITHDRAFT_114444 [Guillardia theta CCMP2712]EKX39481.1 hypothetical protein GUITHDRAFT_114444 [Guillardia theta CCMP2712]|eukprot:XP_005826461.1 hypothetical protein GUITHDRAFT_114444 [Guillardia theta CCMP2712]
MSDKVTVTARMEMEGKGVRALEEWIGHAIDRVHGRVNDESLLYAASRDGFSNQTFHAKCDGKSPTVVIVQLYDGR